MRAETYDFLRTLILGRSRVALIAGQHSFVGGFEPKHQSCHLTSMQVALETGYPPVLGVLFLNYGAKLSPWAHIVNRVPDGRLFDFSPPVLEPKLGFIEMDWSEFGHWREIVLAYHGVTDQGVGWSDSLANALTQEFLALLSNTAL